MISSKSQVRSSREAPNIKLQVSFVAAAVGVWNLEFLWNLEFGTWSF
jgi:hypothetical protein